MNNNDNIKYLNSFTIISYDPNNFNVTFKKETYLINNKKWINGQSILLNSNIDVNDRSQNRTNEEYWIIDENGKNVITSSNKINASDLEKIKAGPFFSMDLVVFYLNYFNEIGM